MRRQDVLNKMFAGKMVQITKSFRKQWQKGRIIKDDTLGQWFYIQTYNADDTVEICSKSTHMIYGNVPIKELLK